MTDQPTLKNTIFTPDKDLPALKSICTDNVLRAQARHVADLADALHAAAKMFRIRYETHPLRPEHLLLHINAIECATLNAYNLRDIPNFWENIKDDPAERPTIDDEIPF